MHHRERQLAVIAILCFQLLFPMLFFTTSAESVLSGSFTSHFLAGRGTNSSYYIGTGCELIRYAPDGTVINIDNSYSRIHRLCWGIDHIYLLDETDTAPIVYVLSPEMNLLLSFQIPFSGYYLDMAVVEPYIYFITEDATGEETFFCEYNFEQQTGEICKEIVHPISISAIDGVLGIISESPIGAINCLGVLYPEKEEIEIIVDGINATKINMMSKSTCILFDVYNKNPLAFLNWTGEKPVTYQLSITLNEDQDQLCCSPTEVYILRTGAIIPERWIVQSLIKNRKTLTIACLGTHSIFDSIVDFYIEQHPEIQIRWIEYPSRDALMLAVIGEEDALDALLVNSYIADNYRTPDVALDIAPFIQNGTLMLPEGYNKELLSLTSKDNFLFGFPMDYLTVTACRLSLPIFQRVGLKLPDSNWTWNDLGNYSHTALSMGCYLLDTCDIPWLHSYLESAGVTHGVIDSLKSEEFHHLCDQWKEWTQLGLIARYGNSSGNAMFIFEDIDEMTPVSETDYIQRVPRFYSIPDVVETDGDELILLRSSSNSDEFFSLLSVCISHEPLTKSGYVMGWMYPNKPASQDVIDHLHESKYPALLFNDNARSIYLEEIQQSVMRGHDRKMVMEAEQLIDQYARSEISWDDFLSLLSARLSMIYYE